MNAEEMSVAETARCALEVLDADGWNKGSANKHKLLGATDPYFLGSHCIGGAWARACGVYLVHEYRDYFLPLVTMIREQYPEIDDEIGKNPVLRDFPIAVITSFNDRAATTEADERAILEKLAAG